MKDTQLKSNETDVTGLLVVVLFIMLGILFVKLTTNLSQTQKSTSTRAAGECKNSPFGYSGYVSSADYCSSLSKQCGDGYVVDIVATGPGCAVCCRSTSSVSYLSATNCRSADKTGDSTSNCVSLTSKAGTGRSKTTKTCGYVTGRYLKTGVCDKSTSTTTATTSTNSSLTATSPGMTASDCGVNHLNCTALFGDGVTGYSYVEGSAIGTVTGINNIDADGTTVYSGICAVPSQYASSSDTIKAQNLTCFVNIKNKTSCDKGIYSYSYSAANNSYTCNISVAGAPETIYVSDGSQADHTCKISVRGMVNGKSCRDLSNEQ